MFIVLSSICYNLDISTKAYRKMSSLDGAILGMENPLLDISADVPTEFLEKYGNRFSFIS